MKKLLLTLSVLSQFLVTSNSFAQKSPAKPMDPVPAVASGVCSSYTLINTQTKRYNFTNETRFYIPYMETNPKALLSDTQTSACKTAFISACILLSWKGGSGTQGLYNFINSSLDYLLRKPSISSYTINDEGLKETLKCEAFPKDEKVYDPKIINLPIPENEWNEFPKPDQPLPFVSPVVNPNPIAVKPPIMFPLPSPTGVLTIIPISPNSYIYPFIEEVVRITIDPKVQQWVKNSVSAILMTGAIAAVILAAGGAVTAGTTTVVSWAPIVAAGAAIILVCNLGGVKVNRDALLLNDNANSMIEQQNTTDSYSFISPSNQIDVKELQKGVIIINDGEICIRADSNPKGPFESPEDC